MYSQRDKFLIYPKVKTITEVVMDVRDFYAVVRTLHDAFERKRFAKVLSKFIAAAKSAPNDVALIPEFENVRTFLMTYPHPAWSSGYLQAFESLGGYEVFGAGFLLSLQERLVSKYSSGVTDYLDRYNLKVAELQTTVATLFANMSKLNFEPHELPDSYLVYKFGHGVYDDTLESLDECIKTMKRHVDLAQTFLGKSYGPVRVSNVTKGSIDITIDLSANLTVAITMVVYFVLMHLDKKKRLEDVIDNLKILNLETDVHEESNAKILEASKLAAKSNLLEYQDSIGVPESAESTNAAMMLFDDVAKFVEDGGEIIGLTHDGDEFTSKSLEEKKLNPYELDLQYKQLRHEEKSTHLIEHQKQQDD